MHPHPAMNIPRGHYCIRLLKSLYELRQSPRNWNTHLHEFITSLGLRRSPLDHCIYQGTINVFVEYHFITRALVCRSATANHLCEELYGLQCIQTLLQD
jgi:hypothetical protein